MKEYDNVELLVDRPRYEREGVKKGMFGVIMSDDMDGDMVYVIFTKFYSGEDIADIAVYKSDLKVWDHEPSRNDLLPEQIGEE